LHRRISLLVSTETVRIPQPLALQKAIVRLIFLKMTSVSWRHSVEPWKEVSAQVRIGEGHSRPRTFSFNSNFAQCMALPLLLAAMQVMCLGCRRTTRIVVQVDLPTAGLVLGVLLRRLRHPSQHHSMEEGYGSL
jgi:hypothetical protein